MTKIKICGITNLQDALQACQFGADALGFVFAKSPRKIPLKKAESICLKLPPFVLKVGVFANQQISFVNRVVKRCNLDYVQLHGEEPPSYCKKVKAKVIKAFRVHDNFSMNEVLPYKKYIILLDTYDPYLKGGTGRTFNWNLAKKIKKKFPNLILSGGLNPKNLYKAIKIVNPYAVDVSSGVEKSVGKKDISKLKKVIRIAHGCL